MSKNRTHVSIQEVKDHIPVTRSILAVRLGTGALLRVDIAFMRSGIHTPARKREHTSTRAHTHKHTLTHKQTRIYVHKYRAAWEISKKPEIQCTCTCNHKGINVVTNSTFLKLNVCCSLNLNRKKHQLEISGPHKVFFVDFDRKLRGRAFTCSTAIFDRKLRGRAFTCSTAIFFQSVASARQEGELRLGDYGHGESQACWLA